MVLFPNDRRFGKLDWKFGDGNDARAQQAYTRLYQVCESCFIAEDLSLRDIGQRIKSDGVETFNATYDKNERVNETDMRLWFCSANSFFIQANPMSLSAYFAVKALAQVHFHIIHLRQMLGPTVCFRFSMKH